MIDTLQKALSKYSVTIEDMQVINEFFEKVEVNKNKYFCKVNTKCNSLGILESGLLKAVYRTKNDNFQISRFFYTPQNIVVSSFESFSKQTPSNESIQAIEDSIIHTIKFEKLNDLYRNYPSFNLIGKKIAEESYILALQRIHDLQTLTVKERKEKFMQNTNSDLYNRLSKQDIASYLKMHRNHLSKP